MSYEYVKLERHGDVLAIGINRPQKANALSLEAVRDLSMAYAEFDADKSSRVGVLHGVGAHFTAGLDLPNVAPTVQRGESIIPPDGINPFLVDGRRLSKPLIAAVHGKCLTLGLELVLATDFAICSSLASFAHLEPSRGLFPFGGITIRLPRTTGWGNAMRWMLTCEEFDAIEAHRIGLVQEVVPEGEHLTRALALAGRVARQAPLAVEAILTNARAAWREGEAVAEQALLPTAHRVFTSSDGQLGIDSFMQPAQPVYHGN